MSGGTWHPDGCRCAGCRPTRRNGGNPPVYRYPPRSHAASCPCPRCAQFRSRHASGVGWGIIIPFFIAAIIFIWPFAVWHGCKYGGSGLAACGSSSEWVWNGSTWIAQGIWWAFLIPVTGLIAYGMYLGKHPRQPRQVPPQRRAAMQAPASVPHEVSPPPASQTPLCLHRNAYEVDSSYYANLGEKVIYRCWCPDCEAELPANFKFPCCGGQPGGFPRDGHLYNCPHGTP